jgi:hypothetical protein
MESFVGTLGEWLARQKDGVLRRPQTPPKKTGDSVI